MGIKVAPGTPFYSGPSNPTEVTDAWLAHAWDGFPRECWNGSRFSKWQLMETKEDYLAFVRRQYNKSESCHTSIQPGLGPLVQTKYVRPWVSKVLLELDNPLAESYRQMRRLYSHLRLKFDAQPRMYYSGNRSFHIFSDFLPLDLDEPVEAPRGLAKEIIRELCIDLDLNVFSERHLSRVPYTTNEKTARFCVSISPFWSLDEIVAESSRPQRFKPIEIHFGLSLMGRLKAIDAEMTGKPKPEHGFNRGTSSNEWIERLLSRPLGDGRHRALWHVLSPYLVNVRKMTFDQSEVVLEEYFTKCNGIQPLQPSISSFKGIIHYYLKVAEKDGYPPWRLQTIERQDPQLFGILKEAGVVGEPDKSSKGGS